MVWVLLLSRAVAEAGGVGPLRVRGLDGKCRGGKLEFTHVFTLFAAFCAF